MITSSDISERFWNLPQKAEEEIKREQTFIDDIIQKAHIERLLLENLDGITTAFDGGGGYGRFSLLLAEYGVKVTHFDISQTMLKSATQKAEQLNLMENITFVQGSLDDLSAYSDNQFDLVISFDAPICYCYPNHEQVIAELVRIANRKICFGVYNRLGWTYQFDPAQKEKYILDTGSKDALVRYTLDTAKEQRSSYRPDFESVRRFFRVGLMQPTEMTVSEYEAGGTPWPISYAFMPDEFKLILEKLKVKDISLAGPGALSRSIPQEVLLNIMKDETLKREFLDFCYWYDSNPYCVGMSKDNLVAFGYV
ncbi:MAG: class I SAM-dependent methyltransferase [Oscillospiraceae bacterium]|nr:class I SAM-dependent methyltransferase [Oscillospiraceae bacterium]